MVADANQGSEHCKLLASWEVWGMPAKNFKNYVTGDVI